MTVDPKKRRGLTESFDPYMLRDGLTTAALGTMEPVPKTSPVVFNALSDTSRIKDVIRQPSMVLRSRSTKSLTEQAEYKDDVSASGKAERSEDGSKNKPSMCRSKILIFAVLLWCLIVVIVLHSIPWEDFEIRWVKKTISDVQWLYPLSRKECTVGQAMLKPVATCGIPQLANAKFVHGPHVSPKRRRYRHSPSFLEALRIIQPSRDYTHIYEFIASGSLVPLPEERTEESQAVKQVSDQAQAPMGDAGGHSPQTVPSGVHVESPPQTHPGVREGATGSHGLKEPQVGVGSQGSLKRIETRERQEAQTRNASGTPSQLWSTSRAQNRTVPILDSVSVDFAFKRFKPASLAHDSVVWCEGSNEPATEHMKRVNVYQPVLFVLGAQHAGVDWLAKSLASHPAFAAPLHSYKQPFSNSTNQLHFFNRWPMPPPDAFIDSFPTASIVRNPNISAEVALFDATPDYLFNSVAAPRIRALFPKARFVVILRDPVARAYVAWRKAYEATCTSDTLPCTVPSFATSVKNSIAASKAHDCLFNTPSASRTWHTCFQCHYSRPDDDACHSMTNSIGHTSRFCHEQTQFNIIDVGNYAAQLAWWFSFFPPQQFLLISHAELQHVEGQTEVLTLVAEHVGLEQAVIATNMLARFVEPPLELTREEAAAALTLRRLFDKSEEDLYKLLAVHGKLGAEFLGLPSEI